MCDMRKKIQRKRVEIHGIFRKCCMGGNVQKMPPGERAPVTFRKYTSFKILFTFADSFASKRYQKSIKSFLECVKNAENTVFLPTIYVFPL